MGNLKVRQERLDLALAAYRESAEAAERTARHDLAAKALANAARIERFRGREPAAESLLRVALDHADALPESAVKAELFLGIGRLLQEQGQFLLSHRTFSDAVRMAEALDSGDLRSFGYGYLGALHLAQGRLSEAGTLTDRAEFLAQASARPDQLFRWQWQRGRIHAKQGAMAAAASAYRAAIATLQPIRQTLRASAMDRDPQDPGRALHYELADLLLRRETLTSAALREVRDVMEQGKAAELENYYRDDCVSAWLDKQQGIDRLDGRTAAVYPILLPDRLELLLSLPGGMERHRIPTGNEEIRREASLLRQRLESRGTPEYLPHAQALYRILLQPLEPSLRRNRIDTLVFLPDGVLRLIPLAALHDGRDFLVRRYAVATSPGLALTDPHPIRPERARALIAGLSQATQGFPPLPNVDAEIRSVADEFPATLLANGDFRRDTLARQLQETPYRIVHIASHGRFGSAVENTFLVAADGKIGMDALGKLMGVSRFREEPVELLTLSACQTAAGDDRAALGLAGVAVKSGARSALASLWFLNDPASAALVPEFYRQLKQPGVSKARALQKAQWKLLDDPRYEHPAYWAPFLLIGNWL